jgi:hypothetical protein
MQKKVSFSAEILIIVSDSDKCMDHFILFVREGYSNTLRNIIQTSYFLIKRSID